MDWVVCVLCNGIFRVELLQANGFGEMLRDAKANVAWANMARMGRSLVRRVQGVMIAKNLMQRNALQHLLAVRKHAHELKSCVQMQKYCSNIKCMHLLRNNADSTYYCR